MNLKNPHWLCLVGVQLSVASRLRTLRSLNYEDTEQIYFIKHLSVLSSLVSNLFFNRQSVYFYASAKPSHAYYSCISRCVDKITYHMELEGLRRITDRLQKEWLSITEIIILIAPLEPLIVKTLTNILSLLLNYRAHTYFVFLLNTLRGQYNVTYYCGNMIQQITSSFTNCRWSRRLKQQ